MARPEAWNQDRPTLSEAQRKLIVVAAPLETRLLGRVPNGNGEYDLGNGLVITPVDIRIWMNVSFEDHNAIHGEAFQEVKEELGKVDHDAVFRREMEIIRVATLAV